WLDSFMDQKLNTPLAHMHPWRRLWREILQPPGAEFSEYETLLRERDLFTLDGYFSYWAEHNSRALSIVPQDRLLVLRTDQISNSLDRIADFIGVPVDTLNSAQSHSFKAPKKHGILKQLDPGFVKEKAERHCADLMKQFFPEIDGPPQSGSLRPPKEQPRQTLADEPMLAPSSKPFASGFGIGNS
ncbi:MAG TPA: hypothetical protein VKA19_07090, partial [Alphaproteobacteria bacterium]|nr:hypothetical protein [Alphaproteobacteria bacterium]